MLLAVIVALVLCVLEITALVVASPMMKPAFLLSFLPEDVRLAAKDHPEPPKSKQILAYVIFAVFIIAMIGGIIFIGMDGRTERRVRKGTPMQTTEILRTEVKFRFIDYLKAAQIPYYEPSLTVCPHCGQPSAS